MCQSNKRCIQFSERGSRYFRISYISRCSIIWMKRQREKRRGGRAVGRTESVFSIIQFCAGVLNWAIVCMCVCVCEYRSRKITWWCNRWKQRKKKLNSTHTHTTSSMTDSTAHGSIPIIFQIGYYNTKNKSPFWMENSRYKSIGVQWKTISLSLSPSRSLPQYTRPCTMEWGKRGVYALKAFLFPIIISMHRKTSIQWCVYFFFRFIVAIAGAIVAGQDGSGFYFYTIILQLCKLINWVCLFVRFNAPLKQCIIHMHLFFFSIRTIMLYAHHFHFLRVPFIDSEI